MLGKSQCKVVIPKRWKTSKVHRMSSVVFSQKPCSGPQHRQRACTEHSRLAELKRLRSEPVEAKRVGICRVENQRGRQMKEPPRNLHKSPLESKLELHDTGGKTTTVKRTSFQEL